MNTDTLAAALVTFQGTAPVIPKSHTARMGSYSYRYADLADMWAALREPLHTAGLAVTQMLCEAGDDRLGIRTTIWHTSGEAVSDTAAVSIAGCTPQEIGSIITYLRRYSLAAALGLSVDDDTDAAGVPAPTAADARTRLAALCRRKGLDPATVAQEFKNACHGVTIEEAEASKIQAFITYIENLGSN